MSEPFETMLSVDDAVARVVAIASNLRTSPERVVLEHSYGRTSADDVSAPFDVPGYVNSAMDGFAVRADDLDATAETVLRLSGEIFAGGSDIPDVKAGHCVRITTGAPLPPGADSVVIKENTRIDGERVFMEPGTTRGANVREAGEDYRAGDLALRQGDVLTPSRVAVLASFGQTHAMVAVQPRAVLLTTGDELIAPGEPLGYGKIHDSNRYGIGGLIEQHGAMLLRHERLRDDPQIVRDALLRAGEDADFIVSSGGVSAGEADYLPNVIANIGKVYFWKVRIKPGMPFLFGQVGKALVFALPGNPVSGFATFLALVKPALSAMLGKRSASPQWFGKLTAPISKRHSRAEFQRASIACDATGQLLATPLPKQGSGMLRGVADADAMVILPEGAHEFAAGDIVRIIPMPGWSDGV
ncbi:MAG: gephyrin-like molybdotransferase Glp [Rudaea sp.]